MPVVIAGQQLILVLGGAPFGLLDLCWLVVATALSWAAATRRSSTAWLVLLALCALALLWSLGYGIGNLYGPEAYPYILLEVVALGLLLARDSMEHVDG